MSTERASSPTRSDDRRTRAWIEVRAGALRRNYGQVRAAVGPDVGVIPMVVGLLYFFPALHLARYASRIGSLISSSRTEDLENALDAQKSFWRFSGILTLVVIVLYLLTILVVIIAAAAGASAATGGRGF